MIKIYFACSVTSGGDTSTYLALINAIKEAGAEVISEIFAHDAINYGGSPLPAPEIYARDIEMINEADAVIAEITSPSSGVGYELGYTENTGKPVLCLFNTNSTNRRSGMIFGNPYFSFVDYSSDKIPLTEIKTFISKLV